MKRVNLCMSVVLALLVGTTMMACKDSYQYASQEDCDGPGCPNANNNNNTGCGNGVCESTEDPDTCPADCGESCGNGFCDSNETSQTCPRDCGGICGDNVRSAGEQCDGSDFSGLDCQDLGYGGGALSCNDNCTYNTTLCVPAALCGDDQLNPGEACDNDDLNGQTCDTLGYDGGTLACGANCQFDTSNCNVDPQCGNGVTDPNEACDTADLNGQDCYSLGYGGGGFLACRSDCQFDTNACYPDQLCGNGALDPGEDCDGLNLDNTDCVALGYTGGGTLTCDPGTCQFNTFQCVAPPQCGNGVTDPGEACDGAQLSGQSCVSLGYASGSLACQGNCQYDFSGCNVAPMCGDGNVGPGEQCDGANLNNKDCVSLGYTGGGVLSCDSNCHFDFSACVAPLQCGNNFVDPGEACDGVQLNGATCQSRGYLGGGTLTCAANCQFDYGQCVPGPLCGDGTMDPGEHCDGANLNGSSCQLLGYGQGGVLSCDNTCHYDTVLCVPDNECGDAQIDPGEQCDGGNLNNTSCTDLGFAGGALNCAANCTFDTSQCLSPVMCGNGQIGPNEQCDGINLAGNTCQTLGWASGSLSCDPNSCLFDTSACIPAPICGDGLLSPNEQCDGAQLNGATCVTMGYASGSLTCGSNCLYDTSGCVPISLCGNNTINPGEQCDTSNLDGADCASLGYTGGGSLSCATNCTYDTSACVAPNQCGNNQLDPSEACDGAFLNGQTCLTRGYLGGGTLTCQPNCQFDTTQCQAGPQCGNNALDPNEPCDGAFLNGMTCSILGYTGGGTLSCDTNCQFDTSACVAPNQCGDNQVDPGEQCDGPALNGMACTNLGFTSGALACQGNCTFDTSGCVAPVQCGDNQIDPGEQCDNAQLAGQTCNSLGFTGGGTLTCDPVNCTFDTSLCVKLPECGDTQLDPGEQCDGVNLNAHSCQSLGYASGTLSCDPTGCFFDTTQCVPYPQCGDSQIDPGEQCDSANLNGRTCQLLGYASGSLSCDPTSCTFDTSACVASAQCGNNQLDPNEACDGANLSGQTCFGMGYLGGGTLTCLPNCQFDTTQCQAGPQCGNGSVDPNEDCDGADLNGATCQSRGYANGGILSCNSTCHYDTTLCVAANPCGNGAIDPSEACDGLNLNGESCQSRGYASGTLTCQSNCQFDTDQCVAPAQCGDGNIDPNEACDTADLNGEDCFSLGFASGTLSCDSTSCQFNTSACVAAPPCGNGTMDPGEQCDGANLNGATCVSKGYASGTLSCNANCTYNTTSCVAPPQCGNGAIDPNEACDGANLGGQTCLTRGYTGGGVLSCANNCQFDVSLCQAGPLCGNGAINPNEQCDGANLSGSTCASLGYTGGGILSCDNTCHFNTSLCLAPVQCGDSQIDPGEACDGANLNGQTCVTRGYASGSLSCAGNCQFDTSNCVAPAQCGDSQIDPGEFCDSANMNGETCQTLGYASGTLTCDPTNCTFNTSACVAPVQCGDNQIDPGEACDSANLNGASCVTLGYASGTLSCLANCQYNTSSCVAASVCGDGNIDPNEQCDTADLDGESCFTLGYVGGPLSCAGNCIFDTSACVAAAPCGDGDIDPGEQCDGAALNGETCVSKGYASGTLSCNPNCTYNFNSCNAALTCGNSSIDPGEACDTGNLNGQTCLSMGFLGGALSCYGNCTYNTTGCTPPPSCGDGNQDVGEQCDGADLGGQTCLGLGYAGGALGCYANCTYNESACIQPASCGDGVYQAPEQCDGAQLNGQSCLTLGYAGGALSCYANCQYNESGCIAPPTCGDGNQQGLEQCDGVDFNGESCLSLGYSGGALNCYANCQFNTSGCIAPPTCGDGAQQGLEQCDGFDLNGESCVSLGYAGGALGCYADCRFNTAACSSPVTCGDGVQQAPEQCDNADLAGETCVSLGFTGGSLSCSGVCSFDTSLCTPAPTCGDSVQQAPEQCDNLDLNGQTCIGLGYAGGTLFCNGICQYDVSSCTIAPTCGNLVCEVGETPVSCPADCAGAELCTGGLDEDGDNATDCVDDDCASYPYCAQAIGVTHCSTANPGWAVEDTCFLNWSNLMWGQCSQSGWCVPAVAGGVP